MSLNGETQRRASALRFSVLAPFPGCVSGFSFAGLTIPCQNRSRDGIESREGGRVTTESAKKKLESALPVVLLLSLAFLAFTVLRPFLPALLWALTLGVALAPLHSALQKRLWNRPSLATTVVSLLMLLFLLLPMLGLSRALIAFVPDIVKWVDDMELPSHNGGVGLTLDAGNLISRDIAQVWATLRSDMSAIQEYFGSEIKPFAAWLLNEGRMLGSFVLEFALGILVAAVLMHEQTRVAQFLRQLFLRIGGPETLETASHAAMTIRTTFIAVLLAAAAQTAVASIAYVASGVPHWAILCAATFLLAMLQVGPILIWAPVAIWLVQGGQTGLAVFVTLWCLIVVGLTDNLVRAVFVSKASHVPGLLAFLGAIGGLMTWGIVGVFLGPVIVAVCYRMAVGWVSGHRDETISPADEVTPER